MKTKVILPLIIIILLSYCCNDNQSNRVIRVKKSDPIKPEIFHATPSVKIINSPQRKISIFSSTGTIKSDTIVLHKGRITLKTLFDRFDKPEQLIHLNGSKDTVLKLEEGTILKIPAGTFVINNEKTPVMGVLEISAREYYKLSDIIFGNLTTQCGGALLESGGMLKVEVRCNGNICSVAEGKSFELGFPDKKNCDKMEMFEGIQNEKGKIVWRHPEKRLIKSEAPKEIFTVVEQQPTYPGGDEERLKFLQRNMKYPEEAKELGMQGTVYLTFVVETDGSVTDIIVLRGIGGGCDEEAMRVVKSMPKWIPGKQRGVPVRVQFNLPINFRLDGPVNTISNKVNLLADSIHLKTKGIGGQLSELNYWFISSYSTGWINCDRFMLLKQGVTDYVLEDPCTDSLDLIMVLHKQKTIVSPSLVKYNKLIFKNIPRNEPITMIGIKVTNNKIYLSTQEDQTIGQTIRRLTFREVDEEDLKKALDMLDRFYQ